MVFFFFFLTKWVLFNDDRVTVASEAEVLNADAYLLFYNLRTLSPSAAEASS